MRNSMILISILSLTACVADEPATGEDTAELDLFAGPPPNGPNVLRVSSSELATSLGVFNGTRLSVDTTETAPFIYGSPETVCTWPNEAQREAAQAECYADFSGSALMACLQQVNVDYPNIQECQTVRLPKYSYVDFTPGLENLGARDIAFDVAPIHKVSSISDIDIDIHWIHNSGDSFFSSAAFEGLLTAPSAVVTMPLTSPSPTLYCYRSLGCPNIDMWNMKVTARLTSIAAGEPMHCPKNAGTPPYNCTGGDAIGASLGFATVQPTFSFNRNLVGIPDFLITALVDVDAKIKDAFESKVKTALEGSARPAVSSVLTMVALSKARLTHPTIKGFSRIRGTWSDAGSLVVQYDWY